MDAVCKRAIDARSESISSYTDAQFYGWCVMLNGRTIRRNLNFRFVDAGRKRIEKLTVSRELLELLTVADVDTHGAILDAKLHGRGRACAVADKVNGTVSDPHTSAVMTRQWIGIGSRERWDGVLA